jgi:hypothetical protein
MGVVVGLLMRQRRGGRGGRVVGSTMCLCWRLGPAVSLFPLVHSDISSLVFDRAPRDRVAEHQNAQRVGEPAALLFHGHTPGDSTCGVAARSKDAAAAMWVRRVCLRCAASSCDCWSDGGDNSKMEDEMEWDGDDGWCGAYLALITR